MIAVLILTNLVKKVLNKFLLMGNMFYIFKITLMLYRMYQGYSRGAKGFNSVEPKHLQAKIKYLYLYLEFLDKKIYLELADKYNIVGISAEPSTVATAESEAN